MAHKGMTTDTIMIAGHNGKQISAYVARPQGAGPNRYNLTLMFDEGAIMQASLGYPAWAAGPLCRWRGARLAREFLNFAGHPTLLK